MFGPMDPLLFLSPTMQFIIVGFFLLLALVEWGKNEEDPWPMNQPSLGGDVELAQRLLYENGLKPVVFGVHDAEHVEILIAQGRAPKLLEALDPFQERT